MDILLGLFMIAVCLTALWYVGYKGLLPPPYDKWAMAFAVALGTGGLWLLTKKPEPPKPVGVSPVSDPVHLPVIEVPSKQDVDQVTREAEDQDHALEEAQNVKPVETSDRGTDRDDTANALLDLGGLSNKPQ